MTSRKLEIQRKIFGMEISKYFIFFVYLSVSSLVVTANEEEAVNADAVSYQNFRVLRIFVFDREEEEAVREYVVGFGGEEATQGFEEQQRLGRKLEIMSRRNGTLYILCSPKAMDPITSFLRQNNIQYEVLISNLQDAILSENPPPTPAESEEWENRGGHRLSWRRYHRFKDIEGYIDYLAHTYKEICETIVIGTSTEGRPLKLMKISTGGEGKPAIWIDGGLHGREWISPATVTYILLQLVEFRDKHTNLLENLDWYILPVSNPDGYEYSHVHDRLWRKTRSHAPDAKKRRPNPSFGLWDMKSQSAKEQCVGADANRNWDFHWREVGASSNPCAEDFAGRKPFSEPETAAIADFIMKHKREIKLFLSLHSYSQMWLIPWGWAENEKPKDYYDMFVLAEKGVNALKRVKGTDYLLGTAAELMYVSSGASDDWAKGVAGIKYAYTIELPDTGAHGFILPASRIESTGQETWEGIKALAQHFADGLS